MIDSITGSELVISAFQTLFLIRTLLITPFVRLFRLWDLYGVPGLFLYFFGSQTTWGLEAQVLGQIDDDDAMQFKKSVQDECTMVSVAAAIVAQIAITALSLGGLSQVHWVAKGFLVFSLIDALMAVYYATTQQRAMGRLLRPKQVRAWIRGGIGAKLPTLDRATRSFAKDMKLAGIDLSPCDPQDLNNNQYTSLVIPNYLRQKCFTPSVVSVITISAPQMLLSGSLITLLLGLGIYFGFTWTDKLDAQAGPHDSRNVFITFVVGLGVCTLVYSLSGLIHDKEDRPEVKILDYHMKEYIRPRKDTLENDWGMYISGLGDQDSLLFVRRVPIVSPV